MRENDFIVSKTDLKGRIAYGKNMEKQESFHWDFASVTPTVDSAKKLVGYRAARRPPRRAAGRASAARWARYHEGLSSRYPGLCL